MFKLIFFFIKCKIIIFQIMILPILYEKVKKVNENKYLIPGFVDTFVIVVVVDPL